MSDEKLQAEEAAGKAAEDFLASPAYQAARENLLRSCYQQWLASPLADQAGREALYFTAQAARRLDTELDAIKGAGTLASNTLRQRGKK